MESKERVFVEHIKNHLKTDGALTVVFTDDLYCSWCKKSMAMIHQDYKDRLSEVLMKVIRKGWQRV